MKPGALVFAVFGCILATTVAFAKETSSDMTGNKEHRMANCPSAAPGAKTRIDDSRGGVILTVTGRDASTTREIQRRAALQVNVSLQPARGALEHTGGGTGSGDLGFCPGMEQGSTIEVDNLADGATIAVSAQAGTSVAQLQSTTRARLLRLQAKR